jgi:hypothetical protein
MAALSTWNKSDYFSPLDLGQRVIVGWAPSMQQGGSPTPNPANILVQMCLEYYGKDVTYVLYSNVSNQFTPKQKVLVNREKFYNMVEQFGLKHYIYFDDDNLGYSSKKSPTEQSLVDLVVPRVLKQMGEDSNSINVIEAMNRHRLYVPHTKSIISASNTLLAQQNNPLAIVEDNTTEIGKRDYIVDYFQESHQAGYLGFIKFMNGIVPFENLTNEEVAQLN